MAIDPSAVGTEETRLLVEWSSKDSLLYALGVGAGVMPDEELEFTTENTKGATQQALPTMAVVLGGRLGALRDALGDPDWSSLVHVGQEIEVHQPLATTGSVLIDARIESIFDKGTSALTTIAWTARDSLTGTDVFTTRSTMLFRGEGGWGGDPGPSISVSTPDRDPDHIVAYQTRFDQALLYRLSGDRNPLHSDPAFAVRAGFERPILHGLCTFGFTGRALVQAGCRGDVDRFDTIRCRFSAPVYPGEDLNIHIWRDGEGMLFRTLVGDRVVIDAGEFTVRD